MNDLEYIDAQVKSKSVQIVMDGEVIWSSDHVLSLDVDIDLDYDEYTREPALLAVLTRDNLKDWAGFDQPHNVVTANGKRATIRVSLTPGALTR